MSDNTYTGSLRYVGLRIVFLAVVRIVKRGR
jgi:hypothetical protein